MARRPQRLFVERSARWLHRHCRPHSRSHDDASCEVLNVGDSRTAVAVVAHVKGGTADVVFATRDHSAADGAEIDRITAAGGEVSCAHGQWRVKVESPEGSS
ncbi:hypothetical protein AB1Y20_005543 [Prymnesium parvum]|uniref:PPM-type phosphatase domain-containing protein n=1 Tax=Prymnesium parvum TaxID=97485 RepID=A0AB34J539_PRYPA